MCEEIDEHSYLKYLFIPIISKIYNSIQALDEEALIRYFFNSFISRIFITKDEITGFSIGNLYQFESFFNLSYSYELIDLFLTHGSYKLLEPMCKVETFVVNDEDGNLIENEIELQLTTKNKLTQIQVNSLNEFGINNLVSKFSKEINSRYKTALKRLADIEKSDEDFVSMI